MMGLSITDGNGQTLDWYQLGRCDLPEMCNISHGVSPVPPLPLSQTVSFNECRCIEDLSAMGESLVELLELKPRK
jgi:hypothetical protein